MADTKETDMFCESEITASLANHDPVVIFEGTAEDTIVPLTREIHALDEDVVRDRVVISESVAEDIATTNNYIQASDETFTCESSIELFKSMADVISIVGNIKNLLIESELRVPYIVVMGERGSGKSSLINSLLDHAPHLHQVYESLPCRSNLGLELRFRQSTHHDATPTFANVELEDTNGPLSVTLYSPFFTDMTVLDTPGYEISELQSIAETVSEFAKDPFTIIIYVIPAGDEAIVEKHLCYLDSISLDRIIPVLSKVDLVEQPIASYYLLNRVNYLVGVSQDNAFFVDHPFFSLIPSKYYGISTVRSELTKKMVQVVRFGITGMAKSIRKKKQEILTRLSVLEAPIPIGEQGRLDFLAEKAMIYSDLIGACRQSTFRASFEEASRALGKKLNQIDLSSNATDNFGDLLDDHLSENSAMAEAYCLSYVNLILDTFTKTISATGRNVFKRFSDIEKVLSDIRTNAISRAKETLEADIRQCIIDRIQI